MFGHAKQRVDAAQRSGAGDVDPFAGALQLKFWWTHLSWMEPHVDVKTGPSVRVVSLGKRGSSSTSSAVAGGSGRHHSTTPSSSCSGSQGTSTPEAAGPVTSWLGLGDEQNCQCKAGCCSSFKSLLLRQQAMLTDPHQGFMMWMASKTSNLDASAKLEFREGVEALYNRVKHRTVDAAPAAQAVSAPAYTATSRTPGHGMGFQDFQQPAAPPTNVPAGLPRRSPRKSAQPRRWSDQEARATTSSSQASQDPGSAVWTDPTLAQDPSLAPYDEHLAMWMQ